MNKTSLEAFLNNVIMLCKRTLDKNNDLVPFGCSWKDGQITTQMASLETANFQTKDLISLLKEGLHNLVKDEKIEAVAYCIDMNLTLPKKTEAICIHLEDHDGNTIMTYLPYAKNNLDPITYEEPWFESGTPEFFK